MPNSSRPPTPPPIELTTIPQTMSASTPSPTSPGTHPSRNIYIAMDDSKSSVNALKWALGFLLLDGEKAVVVCAVEDKESEGPTMARMRSLIAVVSEAYSKKFRLTLRVVVGNPGVAIVEHVVKHSASTLVIGSKLQTHYIGLKTWTETQSAVTHGLIGSYIMENTPPSIPIVVTRFVPPADPDRHKSNTGDALW